MEYRVYLDHEKEWRWRLIADNHVDILADSGQGYVHVEDCYHGIRLVRASKSAVVKNLERNEIVVLGD